ncbi:hypothetical protein PoMZ_00903 [Pyricularia oryzae]|uniref:Uncharacterized protein n=1 Tax=Pyricularia oryzae TaxID=318829 RepID=A0A4P7N0Y5_PYROR|nr:hypothetical protein PoMZ_00903 [Pyricularia oryzae]
MYGKYSIFVGPGHFAKVRKDHNRPPDARSAPAYLSFTIRAGGQAGTGGCAQFGSFHALVG